MQARDEDLRTYRQMRASPLYWVRVVFHLTPQRLRPKFQAQFELGLLLQDKAWDEFCKSVRPFWFEPFRKGHEVTWQQYLLFLTIEKALRGEVPRRISIVSGRGTGKSSGISILILWFLFCYESLITATGPTEKNLMSVLWPEMSRWIQKMPSEIGQLYDWQATYIRMKASPETWFARAITASKESPETLSGAHHQNQMLIADEASGIESNAIFDAASGSLTNNNYLFIMISQGIRSLGYFYDSHRSGMSALWVNLTFNSEESPIVDQEFLRSVEVTYGKDSPQYRVQVLGGFPDEGTLDDKGYVQLFNERDLHIVPFDQQWKPVGKVKGALDASGEGQDTSEWAIKDRMRAAIVATEQISTPASMAVRTLTVCDKYQIDPYDFVIDNLGSGANVGQEIALMTAKQQRPWRVFPINVGEPCEDDEDKEQFLNIRAMLYYRLMQWCRAGGEIMDSPGLKEELMSIRFRRTNTGRIQIMSKVDMLKLGFKSPNKADALSMLFYRRDTTQSGTQGSIQPKQFDPHSPVG
ncbi:hypothetical protein JJE66_33810 [Bradyrhizobium diazoefficiens]|uniref:hypothetical protein n=1 Tax=Bradyrhizobium diazoefficiens TaxID=1355477 RepID=UPI00190C13AE|nr:hypothetical protein [Bradyrhizobium diazoefficiens]MBK3666185.1 hypothetical protein [Bradyrhizobium diazoefficiens]